MNPPSRGEVWVVDLGMAAKVRPAVVVSVPAGVEDRALVTLVPHTTSVRGTTFEAAVPVPFLKSGAFDVQGLVSVPFPRLVKRLGRLTAEQQAGVDAVLARWLGLSSNRI